jgi:hypothetical protein
MQTVILSGSQQPNVYEPDHRAVVRYRLNVLIQGTSTFIAETLAVMGADLPPFLSWPDVPDSLERSGSTVVIHEVAVLSGEALAALADLLRAQPRVQVLATSSISLYELVAGGRFPADLYYRLNVVTLTDDIKLLASGEVSRRTCAASGPDKSGISPST